MKSKASRDPSVEINTPECLCCADQLELHEESFVMLRGVWMISSGTGLPIFVLDPDTGNIWDKLPNGQTVIVTDYFGPTKHAHKECVERLIDEELDDGVTDSDGFDDDYANLDTDRY